MSFSHSSFSLFIRISYVTLLSALLLACQSTQRTSTKLTEVNLNKIQAHMSFLADDLLEGRDSGTRGHEIASLYIANEFAKYGLMPGGDKGTFYQRIEFQRTTLDQNSPVLTVNNNPDVQLDFPNDFIVGANAKNTLSEATGQLVFAGYGIVSEELDLDDYADVDVQGKIVLVLAGRPESIASDVGATLSSLSHKRKNALDRGAIGLISIQTPKIEEARPYKTFLSFIQSPRLSWIAPDKDENSDEEAKTLQARARLSIDAAKKLFAAANFKLDDVFAEVADGNIPKGFHLPLEISLSYKSNHETITSPNVLGILPGSDPNLKDEYVVYTAHSDGLGISRSVEKDRINNGAMDNASGTSILMETARLFSAMPDPPKRSIIFAAVTAEERGLLGADYFVNYPTVSGDIVGNVNLDMPLITFDFEDVIAFGSEHSTMGVSVEKAVSNAGMMLSDDPWPELNLFTRSDHYAFVRKGIPAVFLVSGIQSKTEDVDGSKVLQTFLQTHYHKPSDDMNQKIVWPAAVNFTKVNFEIGLAIANQKGRPAWYEDSFFGQQFGENLVPRD